jgi:hypothetical protein
MITSLALLHQPFQHTSRSDLSCAGFNPAAIVLNVMLEEYPAFHGLHASAPVSRMLSEAADIKTSEDSIQFPPSEVWDAAKEKKYYRLVEREALGKLRHTESQELERLAAQRRTRKNPRTGEEVIKEFEQRQLTRSLVEALTKYVKFHQPTHRSG